MHLFMKTRLPSLMGRVFPCVNGAIGSGLGCVNCDGWLNDDREPRSSNVDTENTLTVYRSRATCCLSTGTIDPRRRVCRTMYGVQTWEA